MSLVLSDLDARQWRDFDCVIDVRSPSEFAEDHVPGAINLPVLSDEERARVGTIYTQDSPFSARKIGAALVARNAARHIEEHLMGHDGGWRPLLYCWRGGQRSGSFATILQQIGWRAETVEGGYRSYRRQVVKRLYEGELGYDVLRLDGNTGTAKTALLGRLAARGVQVIDLEGLAGHRGSILGDMAEAQPSQKSFETALAAKIAELDPTRPLLVEAESARIGELRLPPALWIAMRGAPRLVIDAPVPARAAYLAREYADISANAAGLAVRLDGLRKLVGHGTVDAWQLLAQSGQMEALAEGLISAHYDPAYAHARERSEGDVSAVFATDTLDAEALEGLADQIAAHPSLKARP